MAEAKFYISAERLENAGACDAAVGDFRAMFGNRKVPVTRANIRRAADAGLAISWLFGRLDHYAEYAAWEALYETDEDHQMNSHPAYQAALWATIEKKAKDMGL